MLIDLGAHGPKWTWNNKRVAMANIKKRLDMAMANSEWCKRFPNTQDYLNFLRMEEIFWKQKSRVSLRLLKLLMVENFYV